MFADVRWVGFFPPPGPQDQCGSYLGVWYTPNPVKSKKRKKEKGIALVTPVKIFSRNFFSPQKCQKSSTHILSYGVINDTYRKTFYNSYSYCAVIR
jgi:hypothetical protein